MLDPQISHQSQCHLHMFFLVLPPRYHLSKWLLENKSKKSIASFHYPLNTSNKTFWINKVPVKKSQFTHENKRLEPENDPWNRRFLLENPRFSGSMSDFGRIPATRYQVPTAFFVFFMFFSASQWPLSFCNSSEGLRTRGKIGLEWRCIPLWKWRFFALLVYRSVTKTQAQAMMELYSPTPIFVPRCAFLFFSGPGLNLHPCVSYIQ